MPTYRLSRGAFSRRRRLYCQGMHPPRQLGGERCVDKTVPLDPGFASEYRSHDSDPEMRFAPRPRTGVAGVEMRFVKDDKNVGMKCFSELFFNQRLDRHDTATLSGSACLPLRARCAECIL